MCAAPALLTPPPPLTLPAPFAGLLIPLPIAPPCPGLLRPVPAGALRTGALLSKGLLPALCCAGAPGLTPTSFLTAAGSATAKVRGAGSPEPVEIQDLSFCMCGGQGCGS